MISKINNEIQGGTSISRVDGLVNELNHKVQVKAAWDERLTSGSRLGEVIKTMSDAKIDYIEVGTHTKPLEESEIISRVGGGDLTKGSCSSLAFTYAGNKCGFDVLDFRDGVSRQKFGSSDTIMNISERIGGVVVKHTNDYKKAMDLLE